MPREQSRQKKSEDNGNVHVRTRMNSTVHSFVRLGGWRLRKHKMESNLIGKKDANELSTVNSKYK